tara:strand:+ start:2818 stop:3189 length:372 start_codon:yes stop_codon:yes gene_type:complete
MKLILKLIILIVLISFNSHAITFGKYNFGELVSMCKNKNNVKNYNYCRGLIDGITNILQANCGEHKKGNYNGPFMAETRMPMKYLVYALTASLEAKPEAKVVNGTLAARAIFVDLLPCVPPND